MRALILVFLAAAGVLILSAPASADSWAMPERSVTYSANKQFRLTVDPRQLSGQLGYFSDKVKGREPAGQAKSGAQTAVATLDRRDGARWARVWQAPLVNDVAPVESLVSDDGKTVVTFDNWHSMGYGDDAVVVYDEMGAKRRQFALADFMPESMIKAAGHSVSSIHWRGLPRFAADGKVEIPLRIRQWSNDDDEIPEDVEVVALFEPATGVLTPRDANQWSEAQRLALKTVAAISESEAEQERFMREPLEAPASAGEREWHAYLREAYFRLDPEWCGGFSSTTVLRKPLAPDYAPSLGWLKDALRDKDGFGEGAITLGSPDPANLVREVERIAPRLKRNGLAKFKLYISASPIQWDRLRSALASTGAELILLDPEVAIPQRKDRFDGTCDPMADIEAAADEVDAVR